MWMEVEGGLDVDGEGRLMRGAGREGVDGGAGWTVCVGQGCLDGGRRWMGWRAAGWRRVDGGKWLDGGRLDGGMDGVKMPLGLRGSMSRVGSRGSRFLRFTGVDGS